MHVRHSKGRDPTFGMLINAVEDESSERASSEASSEASSSFPSEEAHVVGVEDKAAKKCAITPFALY